MTPLPDSAYCMKRFHSRGDFYDLNAIGEEGIMTYIANKKQNLAIKSKFENTYIWCGNFYNKQINILDLFVNHTGYLYLPYSFERGSFR